MKLTTRFVISVAIATGLLAVLLSVTDTSVAEVVASLRSLPPRVYFVALACHLGAYLLRAARFRLLVPQRDRPAYSRVLTVSGAHNLAAYVLPAKTGEASFVIYLRKFCGVRAAQGLASLLVSRLLDLAVLCLGLAAACLALAFSEAFGHLEWLGAVGAACLAGGLAMTVLSLRSDFLVRLPTWIVARFGLARRPVGRKILERAEQVALALRAAGGTRQIAIGAALTLPIWLLIFAFYALLGVGLGLPDDVDFFQATFGSGLAMLSNLLPINGLAGFGTQETGWVLGFGLLGVDQDLATRTGLGVHLVQLFNVCVLGLIAHVVMGVLPQREVSAEE
ncbi:MAG: hypothetical protein DHS20C15_30690 [Planctomycetota bacterium]|nr:MAG: hypothetical protein DHS20C15_30690 [Planctomycetota bacterium]